MKLDIKYLLENMTVEEKAGLCSGKNFWWTKAVDRLGIPSIMVSDGPHGLRKQDEKSDHLGVEDSVKAVCFPAGSALASSFDKKLINKLGEYLGEEARAENLHTLLGPAINIKRSPLCGRNFEYLSEDPYMAGEMSTSYVKGVQSKNVGVSVKHYAANNQEYKRMSTDTIVSERALREIYLYAFEKTVTEAKPWTLMCAYNLLNGEYCCENEWLLNKVLRDDWGFDGIVMTDWGAMNDRVKSLKAGLNLEMPSSNGFNDKKIVDAIASGELTMQDLDKSVAELLLWIDRGLAESPDIKSYDKEAHHAFARSTSAECAVLMKNDNNLLPIAKDKKTVFIGSFAANPRFQGGGSSHINCFKISNAVDTAKGMANVSFQPGWKEDGDTADEKLLADAIAAAKQADVAVIFAGLPDSYESEGYDRTHLNMPACQDQLIAEVTKVQPNTVVVLHSGSPVVMPWLKNTAAVLNMYLGGQAVGDAAVDLLFGDASPEGRLAETFPLRLEDTPAYLNFPGNGKKVIYGEDIFVGYRWYDSRKLPVMFPFGFGLSYTDFKIDNTTISASEYKDGQTITVTADVTNIGKRAGKHVVQMYVAAPAVTQNPRAVKELKGFEKVALAPNETKTVTFTLDKRSFAYYNECAQDWCLENGEYAILVGGSSDNLLAGMPVKIEGQLEPLAFSDSTTIGDLIAAGKGDVVSSIFGETAERFGGSSILNDQMVQAMMLGMPLHSLISFGMVSGETIEEVKKQIEKTI